MKRRLFIAILTAALVSSCLPVMAMEGGDGVIIDLDGGDDISEDQEEPLEDALEDTAFEEDDTIDITLDEADDQLEDDVLDIALDETQNQQELTEDEDEIDVIEADDPQEEDIIAGDIQEVLDTEDELSGEEELIGDATTKLPKTVKLNKTSLVYNGKSQKPSLVIKASNGKTVGSSNYTATFPKTSKNVGVYTVKIKFKNSYSGTKNLTYKIVPASTSISSLTSTKNSVKVKYKKKSAQTTGYYIEWSRKSDFSDKKSKKITSYKTVSYTAKNLDPETTYYFRVRAYKTVNSKKYYSAYSAVKSVKTKDLYDIDTRFDVKPLAGSQITYENLSRMVTFNGSVFDNYTDSSFNTLLKSKSAKSVSGTLGSGTTTGTVYLNKNNESIGYYRAISGKGRTQYANYKDSFIVNDVGDYINHTVYHNPRSGSFSIAVNGKSYSITKTPDISFVYPLKSNLEKTANAMTPGLYAQLSKLEFNKLYKGGRDDLRFKMTKDVKDGSTVTSLYYIFVEDSKIYAQVRIYQEEVNGVVQGIYFEALKKKGASISGKASENVSNALLGQEEDITGITLVESEDIIETLEIGDDNLEIVNDVM